MTLRLRKSCLAAILFMIPAVLLAASGIGAKKVTITANRIQVPHLTRYRDSRILKEVNRQIDEEMVEIGCAEPGKIDKTLEVRSAVKLAAKDIFSIYISGSYFCGAYPENDDNRSMTFDLRTGKRVSFEELFQDYERDKKAILSTIFARQVQEAEKHPDPGVEPEDSSCEKSPWLYAIEQLESSDYTFNFTQRGLEVQPLWPHVIQACAVRVTVPYAQLKKFAALGGLLERMQVSGRS
jgi:hypothetical protein